MKVTFISPDYAVTPQIRPEDVADIAAKGYRAIMCNRPDGEDPGQPDFETVAAEARANGLEAMHLPVASGMITDADVEAFRTAMALLPHPVLAYCRSGTRSHTLWRLGG